MGARQLLEAYQAMLFKSMVFNFVREPSQEQIARVVPTAVKVFLAAYRALSRWQPPPETAPQPIDPLSPWLYRIATNRALSLLRSQASQSRTPQQPPRQGLRFDGRHQRVVIIQSGIEGRGALCPG